MGEDYSDQAEFRRAARPHFVYLRPFSYDSVRQPWYFDGLQDLTYRYTTLDDELSYILEPDGATIAIGDYEDGPFVGIPRIPSTDEQWEPLIVELLASAKGIVVVPGPTPGILKELRRICADRSLLQKTVFVMPTEDKVRMEVKATWRAVNNLLKVDEMSLPAYQGAHLFKMYDKRGYSILVPFEFKERSVLRQCLVKLLSISLEDAKILAGVFGAMEQLRTANPKTGKRLRSPLEILLDSDGVISLNKAFRQDRS